MVLIHSMDSHEELQIQIYEEPDAFAASSSDMRSSGIKMTPKVPPQFDGQSSWFEYEDLIDDWLGITTLDPEKHGPSLKNALVGAASFYKSMLDNTLLRDADRGLSHFKDTLRPYFVKGGNHVFLWRFLQLFRTYRGQHEFAHWIGRFEMAQKRLLASWADLIDLSDLPEVGTPEFMAALTEEQRQQFNMLQTDEERAAYQTTLREQTIANRRNQHQNNFPLTQTSKTFMAEVSKNLPWQYCPKTFMAQLSKNLPGSPQTSTTLTWMQTVATAIEHLWARCLSKRCLTAHVPCCRVNTLTLWAFFVSVLVRADNKEASGGMAGRACRRQLNRLDDRFFHPISPPKIVGWSSGFLFFSPVLFSLLRRFLRMLSGGMIWSES